MTLRLYPPTMNTGGRPKWPERDTEMLDIINWVLIAASIPVIVVLVNVVRRRARELDARIDQYHEQQEAAKQKGPVDPYADLAALYGAQKPQAKSDDPEDPKT